MKKLIYGIGINDAGYTIQKEINGKQVMCPFYQRWKGMMARSYCKKIHARQPTYIGASVCEEWLTFSKFKKWMETQEWEGNDLDKDIIKPGNKIYAPEFCCFVSRRINGLLNDCRAKRGDLPIGVYYQKDRKDYRARCWDGMGFQLSLGEFSTPNEAHKAYIKCKVEIINSIASQQNDLRIANGLRKHAEYLQNRTTP